MNIFFFLLGLLSIAFSIWYMLKVKREGEANSSMPDVLKGVEMAITLITIFFGGIIIVGSIYYYGWKKRFPQKAKSILYFEIGYILLIAVILFASGYWSMNRAYSDAEREGMATYEHMQQAKLDTHELQMEALFTASTTPYQGDGFSMDIPNGWYRDTLAEPGWRQTGYEEAIYWHTTGSTSEELEIVVLSGPDDPSEAANKDEALWTGWGHNNPDTIALSHPTISGASEASLAYPLSFGESVGTELNLFVHAHGKTYLVKGLIDNGQAQVVVSDEEQLALKNILLSFKITP